MCLRSNFSTYDTFREGVGKEEAFVLTVLAAPGSNHCSGILNILNSSLFVQCAVQMLIVDKTLIVLASDKMVLQKTVLLVNNEAKQSLI